MAQVSKIAPGEHADHWDMCLKRNCILIGWRALRDYRKFKSEKAILRALSGEPGDGSGAARSIWRFTNEVKPFDREPRTGRCCSTGGSPSGRLAQRPKSPAKP